jgi:hypothetical protein
VFDVNTQAIVAHSNSKGVTRALDLLYWVSLSKRRQRHVFQYLGKYFFDEVAVLTQRFCDRLFNRLLWLLLFAGCHGIASIIRGLK